MPERSLQEHAPVLVIAGMHRSGTSLLASLCQAGGLDIGTRLLGAYPGNETGHFEDLDFVEWHEAVLRANGFGTEGFLSTGIPDVPDALRRRAEAAIDLRRATAAQWGWKDPRTTLHLDFWKELVPKARFLFVVRHPWDVIDSLFRRGDETFRINPPFAVRVWLHYNRLVQDFASRHPDRSLVRMISQVVEEPGEVFAAIRDKLGVPLSNPGPLYRPGLMATLDDAGRIALVVSTCPEAIALYDELATLAGGQPASATMPARHEEAAAVLGYRDWSESRAIEARVRLLETSLQESRDATAGLEIQLRDTQATHVALEEHHRSQLEAAAHKIRDLEQDAATDQERLEYLGLAVDVEKGRIVELENHLNAAREAAVEVESLRFQSESAERRAQDEAARVVHLQTVVESLEADNNRLALEAETEAESLRARIESAESLARDEAAQAAKLRTVVESLEADNKRLALEAAEAESLADRIKGFMADESILQDRCAALEAESCDLRQFVTAAERNVAEQERARRAAEGELSRIHSSNSWRLTSLLRTTRRVTLTAPLRGLRCWASAIGRTLWRTIPISIPAKERLREKLFTRFGRLFYWTDSYRDWSLVRRPASVVSAASVVESQATVAHASPAAAGVRLIAMHLPQFHQIPENDAWWGEGFTEWTNVRRGRPMYPGHHQPHVPHPDIGFYDLADPAVLERQAALAAANGIHGFCFYYYWFGGRRLLEKPLDTMLRSGKPEFPFCICWANENWTRTWDGRDTEILMRQSHAAGDAEQFIRDLLPMLRDPRYIRVDGRPLIAVYRTESLPDPRQTAAVWRDICRAEGIGEIHLVAVRSFSKHDPARDGFDAAMQFPPLQIPAANLAALPGLEAMPGFAGSVHDYEEAIGFSLAEVPAGYRMYRGVMPSWDNTARRMERATSWVNATPERYGQWLTAAIDRTIQDQPPEHRLVFINAWNEWAEGACLEPDERHGYACLEQTALAMGLPTDGRPQVSLIQATLTSEPRELGLHAWSRVCGFFGTGLSQGRYGFLADYTSLLGQLASGGELRIDAGRPVARVDGINFLLDNRTTLAEPLRHLRDIDQSPFCFVVLQHGRFDVTARCLESLRRLESRRPVRIILVDNGSADDVLAETREAVATMPDVELVETGKNLGFAAGNNVGYSVARDQFGAAFMAVINNDTRIEDVAFVDRCEGLFDQYAFSILGPDIVTPDGRHENPWNDVVYAPDDWRKLKRMYQEDLAVFERTGEARFRRPGARTPEASFLPNPLLQGAAIILSPVFVHATPVLFDERTRLYGEEFPLAVSSLLAGHFMAYSADLRMLHEEGVTTGAMPSNTKMRLGYENASLAAGVALAELDNFVAASRGEPLACDAPELDTLLRAPRRHVLVDLFFCQPGYHGGGEYGKAVFRALARSAAARGDVRLWVALDPALFIDPWILEECRRLAIRVIAVRSYGDIVKLVNRDLFEAFYCPAIVVYTGYEYMRRAGTTLPFTVNRTRVIGALLDIRDLLLIRDRERIVAALELAGWKPSRAGAAASFLAPTAPNPTDLEAMYAAICGDPHVDTIVTISDYCKEVIQAAFPSAMDRLRVFWAAEKDRPDPEPFHPFVLGDQAPPFALVVNAARSEKNAASVVAAFDRLFTAGRDPFGLGDLRVLLVGLTSLDELGLGQVQNPKRFVVVPEVRPGQLEFLFAEASLLVYASFNEGFGYPPVEAMRYGTPSVVADTSSIPEVCGDAAVYCDPFDLDSITAAILRVIHDPPSADALASRHAAIVERQRRDLLALVRLILESVKPIDSQVHGVARHAVAGSP